MTQGSCGKEPDECESLTSGSESGVEEAIPLPTVTVPWVRIIQDTLEYRGVQRPYY